MKKKLIEYIREESCCNYADLIDYMADINSCGEKLELKYLRDLIFHIAKAETEE